MTRAWTAAAAATISALTFGLSACGGDDSSSGGGGGTKEVVYVPGLTGNPFYSTVSCGAQAAAKQLGGVKFSTQGADEFDVAKQTVIVNALTSSKPDAIMISVTDAKALIAPLTQAKAAGIKILTIDGDLADTGIGVSNIQSNNLEGGKLAAQRLGKVMGGKGAVAVIDNRPGVPVSLQRIKGFTDEMAKSFPEVEVLKTKYTDNDVTKAASIVTATVAGNPNLRGVYTAETNNTEGALTGVREARREGKIKIVGYDTSDPIVKALQEGRLDGAVVQFPYGEGETGLKTAVAAIDGKKVSRNQKAPFVVATPDTVDDPKVQKYIYSTTCKK